MKLAGRFAIALLVAGVIAGCGRDRDPVAELQVAPAEVRLGYPGFVPVVFTWKVLAAAPPASEPTVFVHLREEGGAMARTFDHEFPEVWQPGTTVRDEVLLYQSALGPALAPGTYRLTAGLYDPSGRWELAAPGERVDRGEYLVARVTIDAETGGEPSFAFSDSWWPQEPGEDTQVLGRRWLAGEGIVRVAGTAEAGVVLLRVRLPEDGRPGTATVPDGAPPALAITSDCAPTGIGETTVTGPGLHDVTVPVPAGAGGTGCDIVLRSNATAPADGEARPRSALLEVLAWRAASATSATGAASAAGAAAAAGEPGR